MKENKKRLVAFCLCFLVIGLSLGAVLGSWHESAREKLLEFDMDLTAVIRDYLKPPPKAPAPEKTLNQRIYQEIRTFMDVTPQKIPLRSIQ